MKQQVSLKTYLGTVLILLIITFASVSFVRSAGETAISDKSFVSEASYIVGIDGSNTYIRNGETGEIDWSSTSSSAVATSSFGNLTAGRTWKEKVLFKGDFTFTSKVTIPSYTTLEIQGKISAGNNLDTTLFESDIPSSNIEIFGGIIDGNKDNQASPTDDKCTIHMKNVTNLHIHDLTVLNGWTSAIRTYACTNVQIENNYVENSADDNIAVNEDSSFVTVSNNILVDAGKGVSYGSPHGIEIQDNAHHVLVENNIVKNASGFAIEMSVHAGKTKVYMVEILGNECSNGSIHIEGIAGQEVTEISVNFNLIDGEGRDIGGVEFDYAKNCEIKNNYIYDCERGVRLDHTGTDAYNAVESNTIIKHDYEGIRVNSGVQNCTINQNIIRDCGEAEDGSQVAIAVFGDSNTIHGNHIEETRQGASRTMDNGIVFYSGADDNTCKYNAILNVASPIVNVGSNNEIKYNDGFVTENSGTSEASNDDYIAHGLAGEPNYVDLTIEETDANYFLQLKATNSTHFQVYLYFLNATACTDDKTVNWYAEYQP